MNTSLNKLTKSIRYVIATSTAVAVTAISPVYAQQVKDDSADVEKIAVVGSRSAPRSVADSPVPIDIIGGDELGKSASTDMLDMLVSTVPSFTARA